MPAELRAAKLLGNLNRSGIRQNSGGSWNWILANSATQRESSPYAMTGGTAPHFTDRRDSP
jgi:hypothetical protein